MCKQETVGDMTREAAMEREIREQWFPNHVALFESLVRPSLSGYYLRWAKPETNIYKVEYMIQDNVLVVVGDIGEAVYQWSGRINWLFLAGCNIDYFAEKCRASERGCRYEEWNMVEARADIAEFLAEQPFERECFEHAEGYGALCSQEEWLRWLDRHGDDIFGCAGEWANVGQVVTSRCHAHLIGIKMAVVQSATAAAKEETNP